MAGRRGECRRLRPAALWKLSTGRRAAHYSRTDDLPLPAAIGCTILPAQARSGTGCSIPRGRAVGGRLSAGYRWHSVLAAIAPYCSPLDVLRGQCAPIGERRFLPLYILADLKRVGLGVRGLPLLGKVAFQVARIGVRIADDFVEHVVREP